MNVTRMIQYVITKLMRNTEGIGRKPFESCFYSLNLCMHCRLVDNEILNILRQRFEDCIVYEAPDHVENCKHVLKDYKDNELNWYIKCKLTRVVMYTKNDLQ